MEIIYQNKIEDLKEYIEFLLQSKEHRKEIRAYFILIIIIAPALTFIALFLIAWLFSKGSWEDGVTMGIAGFVLSPIYLLIRSKFRPVYYFGKIILEKKLERIPQKEKDIFLLPRKIKITPDNIQSENALASHKWKWEVVKKISITSSLIIVCISSSCYYLIPKRTFELEDDFLEFHKQLLAYKNDLNYPASPQIR